MEDFLWQSSDLLGRLDEMREDLNANDFADDVGMAKQAVDMHMESRRKVVKVTPADAICSTNLFLANKKMKGVQNLSKNGNCDGIHIIMFYKCCAK